MKKFAFLLVFAGLSSAFALSNAQIIAFYEDMISSQVPNVKVSIGKRTKLTQGYESVELIIRADGEEGRELLFVKDDFMFPDIIDVKGKKSYRQDYEEQKRAAAKAEFEKNAKVTLKAEPYIIALGDAKKPKVYVFSDPECPYCRAHLATIEDELKKYQVNFVLTTVHGDSGFHKVAQIYTEIKKAPTDAQKIAILRKYYAPNAKTPKASQNAYNEAVKLYEKYGKMGLRSVPTFVEE